MRHHYGNRQLTFFFLKFFFCCKVSLRSRIMHVTWSDLSQVGIRKIGYYKIEFLFKYFMNINFIQLFVICICTWGNIILIYLCAFRKIVTWPVYSLSLCLHLRSSVLWESVLRKCTFQSLTLSCCLQNMKVCCICIAVLNF